MCLEFIALASTSKQAEWLRSKEVEWLRNLMYEIPLLVKLISPVAIYCDSDSILNRAYCQTYNGKSRYIARRYSLVHDLIKGKVISIDYVNTKQHGEYVY